MAETRPITVPVRVEVERTGPVGFDDLQFPEAHDAPRLRVLPNLHGEPRHYLVLDRLGEELVSAGVGDWIAGDGVPVLVFPFEVELPGVDDDYRDGDEELVQWPQFVGGTRQLGPGLIGTAEGPGEPGSVLNWEGVNYVPQRGTDCERCGQNHPDITCPEVEPNGISADDRERLGDDTCPGGC